MNLSRLITGALALATSLLVSSPVVAEMTLDPGTSVTFHHHDLLGSPVMVSDHKGRVLWYENTKPYGESLGKKSSSGLGHLDNTVNEAASNLGYTGHTVDSSTGLVYMKARHYDPVIGRFYSNDPVGFKASNPVMFNRYAYANNNPYTFVDPDGRDARDIEIIQKHIAENFPEIRSNISVEYKDLGQNNGRAALIANKLYLPESAKTEKLDADTFAQRYETVLHESMHVTDNFLSSWGRSIVEVWSAIFSGRDTDLTPHHQSIYNRVDYELKDVNTGPPTKPVWYNSDKPPESPVGVDPVQLFEETRDTEED